METKIYTIICASTFNDSISDLSIEIVFSSMSRIETIATLTSLINAKIQEGEFTYDDIAEHWQDSIKVVTDESTFLYEIKEQIINI